MITDDIIHELKYVIIFDKPVDLFDVIKHLQIDLRNDFVGNQYMIEVIKIRPEDDIFKQTDFYKKYIELFINKDWIHINSSLYNNISIDNQTLINTIKNDYKQYVLNQTLNHSTNIEQNHSTNIEQNHSTNIEQPPLFINISESEYINFWLDYMRTYKNTIDNIILDQKEQLLIQKAKLHPQIKNNIKFIGWIDLWLAL
jgi:hypothetical protein